MVSEHAHWGMAMKRVLEKKIAPMSRQSVSISDFWDLA